MDTIRESEVHLARTNRAIQKTVGTAQPRLQLQPDWVINGERITFRQFWISLKEQMWNHLIGKVSA